jgi:hypothetical protein
MTKQLLIDSLLERLGFRNEATAPDKDVLEIRFTGPSAARLVATLAQAARALNMVWVHDGLYLRQESRDCVSLARAVMDNSPDHQGAMETLVEAVINRDTEGNRYAVEKGREA